MRATAMAFLVMALIYVPGAQAASVPLGSGETKIALDSGFYKGLRQHEIAIKTLGPATLKGRKLTLPVTAGSFDSGAEEATVAHGGGLRLTAPTGAVTLKKLTLDPVTKSLSAVLAGKRVRLASLGSPKLEREGFDAKLGVKRLRLTGAAAAALNRVFGPRVFRAGRSLGSAATLAEPSELAAGYREVLHRRSRHHVFAAAIDRS